MQTLLFITCTVALAAFVFAVFFGKPSKDEPLRPTVEEWELHWTKQN
jgi:hypothetical protein